MTLLLLLLLLGIGNICMQSRQFASMIGVYSNCVILCHFDVLLPHLYRTYTALLPHLYRTSTDFLPLFYRNFAEHLPHLYGNFAAIKQHFVLMLHFYRISAACLPQLYSTLYLFCTFTTFLLQFYHNVSTQFL